MCIICERISMIKEGKNKYFVNDDLKRQATKIELINNDYDVVFEDYYVSKNEKNEIVYTFEKPLSTLYLNFYYLLYYISILKFYT